MIGIGIVGCAGRMGRLLVAETLDGEGVALAGGIDVSGAGGDLALLAGRPPIGLAVGGDLDALAASCDVLIDFTIPAASRRTAEAAVRHDKALVLGTTGLDADESRAIERAAGRVPIVWAANYSPGVTLLIELVGRAARALGPDYDIEIVEMHHRRKIDAPSGTALALGRAAAAGRGVRLDEVGIMARSGETGPRPAGAIGFATLRGGGVVGDHAVILAADGERIELGHRAADRRLFAAGALRAARWVHGRAAGLHDMQDVLGLRQ